MVAPSVAGLTHWITIACGVLVTVGVAVGVRVLVAVAVAVVVAVAVDVGVAVSVDVGVNVAVDVGVGVQVPDIPQLLPGGIGPIGGFTMRAMRNISLTPER